MNQQGWPTLSAMLNGFSFQIDERALALMALNIVYWEITSFEPEPKKRQNKIIVSTRDPILWTASVSAIVKLRLH